MASYIYEAMRGYQRQGAHFGRRAGSFLLADQPGLGKTIQALGTILAEAAKHPDDTGRVRWHLILCPSVAVESVWVPEIQRWLADQDIEILPLTGSNTRRQGALDCFCPRMDTRHVFVVTNIEAVRVKAEPEGTPVRKGGRLIRWTNRNTGVKMCYDPDTGAVVPALFSRTWDTVVCDESHRALVGTGSAQKTTQTRAGMVLLPSERRIALSGTPMRGKPEQLWGTLNWLDPESYRSYWKWVKEFFHCYQGAFGWVVENDPAKHPKLAESLRPVMLRRTKAEVAPELPAKMYAGEHAIPGDAGSPIGVWLDPSPEMRKQITEFEREGAIFGEAGEVTAEGPLALYTRARQLAGTFCEVEGEGEDARLAPTIRSPKYEWLKAWLEAASPEDKIVVVSQFTSILSLYGAALEAEGYEVVQITGKVSQRARTRAVELFQHGSAQVCMLNIAAGGVALTLDAADYMVFLDETTIPDETEQAEDRIHRVSRRHNVVIYKLITKGTVEEEIAFVAAARQDIQAYLLDGARGVEYARKLYEESRQGVKC